MEKHWTGARGLAEDVRYYGRWMRDEAEKCIGHLYPKFKVTRELVGRKGEQDYRPDLQPYVGQELIVIAWLWARTVPSPNPAACSISVPLCRSFWLCTRKGSEVYLVPTLDPNTKNWKLRVRTGSPPNRDEVERGTKLGRGASFRCLVSGTPIEPDYLHEQFQQHRDSSVLVALVVESGRRRFYLEPADEHTAIAGSGTPGAFPEEPMPTDVTDLVSGRGYGFEYWHQLFTRRQLTTMTLWTELLTRARQLIARHAGEDRYGCDNNDYARGVATYLAFAIDKNLLTNCTQASWQPDPDRLTQAYARQALPMKWDYAEANPLSSAGGGFIITLESLREVLERLPERAQIGQVQQADAAVGIVASCPCVISTDPPYYGNINYADLSDFFYVWLRRSLKDDYPSLFSTVLTPKTSELVALSHRHNGDSDRAMQFFEKGLGRAFSGMLRRSNQDFPVTVFYAFKQSETDETEGDAGDTANLQAASTGWETMLEGLLHAGFAVTGTWPMRTELTGNLKKQINALATSVVLVCRARAADAGMTTRKDFLAALKQELPEALRDLQSGNIAPVDLAQAAIGPGMAVFSRYNKVLETDGSPMRVRTALALINQVLDEVLAEQEAEFDADTRWALAWFEQHAHEEGPYGDAETLSKAKNVAVSGLVEAGILAAKGGKVRLLRRAELDNNWDPATDRRLTIWEVTQHLIRQLDQAGESGAADLLRKLGSVGDVARDLAYRLYTTCERKKWAQEALAYNSLVVAWPEVSRLARQAGPTQTQAELFG